MHANIAARQASQIAYRSMRESNPYGRRMPILKSMPLKTEKGIIEVFIPQGANSRGDESHKASTRRKVKKRDDDPHIVGRG